MHRFWRLFGVPDFSSLRQGNIDNRTDPLGIFLFSEKKTGEAFEKTIFEAAERCGWKLYAYVVMSNHYHLALFTGLNAERLNPKDYYDQLPESYG